MWRPSFAGSPARSRSLLRFSPVPSLPTPTKNCQSFKDQDACQKGRESRQEERHRHSIALPALPWETNIYAGGRCATDKQGAVALLLAWSWSMVTAENDAEMADDGSDCEIIEHHDRHQLHVPQAQGDSSGAMRDMRSPRLRHTHHVLSQLRAYLSSTPDELNATLRCHDGDFLTNKILLAAMSTFLRSVCACCLSQFICILYTGWDGPTVSVLEM